MLFSSLERIDFQLESKLASRMISVCQEIMDEVKSSRTLNPDGSVTRITSDRLESVTKIINQKFSSVMDILCKEELNLNTQFFFFEDTSYVDAWTYTDYKALKSESEDFETIIKGRDIYSGTAKKYDAYDINFFKTYSNYLNLSKSKLETFTTDHYTVLCVGVGMFLGEELWDPKLIPVVTTKEAAGIILHELGHAISTIEHMSEQYHRAQIAGNTVKYLNEKADPSATKKMEESLPVSLSENKNLTGTVVSIKDLKDGSIKNSIIAIVFAFYAFIFLMSRVKLYGRFGNINKDFEKTSDTVVTLSNAGYNERIADEFAARHGLGTPLASVLAKAHLYWEQGHTYNSYSEAAQAIGSVKATLLSMITISSFLSTFFVFDAGVYDPDWLRFEHILADNMLIFKDEKLPPEVRTRFLNETQELMKIIQKYKSRNFFKAKQFFWGFIFRIISRDSLSDSFSTANLSNDYDKLQLLTNGLIKNKLHMHAARLQNL